jgi:hypothetical protein
MSSTNISIDNNFNYYFEENSEFTFKYYSKRMKLWHPYADIMEPMYDDKNITSSSNLDMLLKAIDFVENNHD